MIIPVRCYTCGKVLADKYEYYKKELIRKKLALKSESEKNKDIDDLNDQFSKKTNINNNNKDPLMIDISIDDVKKTIAGEIMDEIGLHRICCRKVMLTSIEIIDEI
jgi:DNA-directed RNA polymerase subunit N (RpoN/RPB10)